MDLASISVDAHPFMLAHVLCRERSWLATRCTTSERLLKKIIEPDELLLVAFLLSTHKLSLLGMKDLKARGAQYTHTPSRFLFCQERKKKDRLVFMLAEWMLDIK
jgi:hypothetical protein